MAPRDPTHQGTSPSHSPWPRWSTPGIVDPTRRRSWHVQPWLVALAITLATVVAAFLFWGPFYDTGDDVAMRLTAEGRFGALREPDPHLLYINAVLGRALAAAYAAAPSVPWYDLHLLAGLVAATFAIALAILRVRLNPMTVFITVGVAGFVLLYSFVRLQFTVVAMMLGTGSVALALSYLLRPPQPLVTRALHLAVCFGLLVWSGLVRPQGAQFALLLAAPAGGLVLLSLWREQRSWRDAFGPLATIIAAGVAVLALDALNRSYYAAAPDWSDFYRFIAVLVDLQQYLDVDLGDPRTAEVLAAVEWTENDFVLLRNWYFADLELYSLERLETAQRLLQPLTLSLPAFAWVSLRSLKNLVTDYWPYWLFVVLVGSVTGRRSTALQALVVMIVTLFLVVTLEILTKEVPFRVLFPAVGVAAIMVAVIAAAQAQARPNRWAVTAGALLALLVAYQLVSMDAWWREREAGRAALAQEVDRNLDCGSCLRIFWGGSFPYEVWLLPFRASPDREDLPFIPLGAASRTPVVQDFLEARNIDDLLLWVCTTPDVEIVARANYVPWLRQYLVEHHGLSAEIVPLGEVPPRLRGQPSSRYACSVNPA